MPLIGTLRDTFDDNVVDASRWPGSYGIFTETGGRARVTCDTGFNAYASATDYILAGSQIRCQVYPPAIGGAASEAYAQVLFMSATAGTDVVVEINRVPGLITFSSRTGFFDPGAVSIPYDPSAHLWVGMREDSGTLYWETSRDGVAWTVRRSAASPAWLSFPSSQLQLLAHRDAGVTDFAEFDNVNVRAGCGFAAEYSVLVDWSGDAAFTGVGEDVTGDVLDSGGIVSSYGRDQSRQLSPTAVGRAAFSLCNFERLYSPENTASPLFGDLQPARDVKIEVAFLDETYPISTGYVDDFEVHSDISNRTVDFTVLDGLSILQGVEISTELLYGYRTGQIIHAILDAADWPTDRRDIDVGATFPRWWWAEGQDAFSAVQEIVLSEGPPAIAYVAPDGVFTFRDRHHRLLDAASLTSQATFSAAAFACDSPSVTGLDYLAPFEYQHGWRDIINTVEIDTQLRTPNPLPSVVWMSDTPISLVSGETVEIEATADDPFTMAVVPEEGTDYTETGGTVAVSLTRTSGQSVVIRLMATGATVVTGLQLRAISVPDASVTKVTQTDSTSVADFGIRTYPQAVPWANANDALAVAQLIIAHYATRRPIVKLRIVTQDAEHFLQAATRTISDRITIVNDEMGLSDDFHIEQVAHTIRRINPDRPPVHYTVFGCERQLLPAAVTPFIFDMVGHGFDDGAFGGIGIDDPSTVFIFDHPTQGQFDVGFFGT